MVVGVAKRQVVKVAKRGSLHLVLFELANGNPVSSAQSRPRLADGLGHLLVAMVVTLAAPVL